MKLRPMTMDDARLMLRWKNYSETRRFAIKSKGVIKLKDHLMWLKDNIHLFLIINDSAGAIRRENGEISVWIDRSMRGKGLAVKAIRRVSKKGDWAKIVDGNIASMRCFIKAGFLPATHKGGYYIFKRD